MAAADIETGLTEKAWRDPEFASLLIREPAAALAKIGVELPAGVRVDVRIQDPNTLYYLIPPSTDPSRKSELGVVTQMDLWRSGDTFCWVIPEGLKFALLDVRLQYRSWQSQYGAEE
jgi:hypothetical protein